MCWESLVVAGREGLEEFLYLLNKSAELLAEWIGEPRALPPRQPPPPLEGETAPPRAVLEILAAKLKSCRRLSAYNLGSLEPPPLVPSLAAYALSALLNPNNAVELEELSATATASLERECVRALEEIVGYDPSTAGGTLVSCGTLSILTALLVARDMAFGEGISRGLYGSGRMVVLASSASHFSLRKAARVLGMGEAGLVEVPVATEEEIEEFAKSGAPLSLKPRVEEYEERARELEREGAKVIALVPTLGTTGTGTVEPVAELVELCEELGARLHVDAALGGFALLSSEVREKARGVERSDSATIDPHKLGFVQYPCSSVLFRDGRDLDLLRYEGPYLRGAAPTIEGSRPGAQAAALWAALKSLGKEGYRALVERCLRAAEYFAKRLVEEGYQLLHEVDLNIVCFSLAREGAKRSELNKLNRRVYERVNERGKFRISYLEDLGVRVREGSAEVRVEGIRAIFTNPLVTEDVVEELLEELRGVSRAAYI